MGCNTSQELKNLKLNENDAVGGSNNGVNEDNEDKINGCNEINKINKQNNASSNIVPSPPNKVSSDYNSDKRERSDNQPTNQNDIALISKLESYSDIGNDEEDEAKAATKIQAVFRGHKVRATMKKSDNMPNKDDTKESNQQNDSNNDVEPTKEELEAEFDPNDKELCDAALKIQATFRGHLSRKLVNKDPEDVDIEEITKKVAEELDIDLSDPELNKAATKIQASFRGHKIRKDVTN